VTLAQVAALHRLLVDPLERERLRRDVERLVGAMHETMAVPSELVDLEARIDEVRHRPMEALHVARKVYVVAMLAVMEDVPIEVGMLACSANVCAALALLACRDHEARRWLRIAELEAEADGLDGRETVLAWWRAIAMVADDR
jgi:hypothetical protein